MVKGNKFKTVEFLKKQVNKTQSKPSAAVIAELHHQQAATGPSSQQAQTKTKSPAVSTLKDRPQPQLSKAGNKRRRSKDALAEVVNASVPLPTHQTAEKGKRYRSTVTDEVPAQPKSAGTGPNAKKQKFSKPAVPTILAAPAPQGKAFNSNWAALKGTVTSKAGHRRQASKGNPVDDTPAALKAPKQIGTREGLTPVVALDCEMVGVGPDGIRSALARWELRNVDVAPVSAANCRPMACKLQSCLLRLLLSCTTSFTRYHMYGILITVRHGQVLEDHYAVASTCECATTWKTCLALPIGGLQAMSYTYNQLVLQQQP